MKKLVIFDLDGTLLNSLDDLATSANHALAALGYPTHPLSAYKYFVGNGINKLLERALPEGQREEKYVMDLREEFFAHYTLHKADRTAPYAGIMDLLYALRERGICLAVASNKFHSATESLVRTYFGEDLFRVVYGQREGVPPKPDPRVVYDILHETGIDKREVLYVGDTGVDMQTAYRAGIFGVGVTWGFRSREELQERGACVIVDHPSEILNLVE